jgi:hypothetical protein
MLMYRFLIGTLFVWRITHLFNAEDGPGDMFVSFRRCVGAGFVGQLLDCFYCLSLWISAPLAILLGKNVGERMLLWPALSAGAILLERITNYKLDRPPVFYIEDKEDNDALLRR